MRTTNGRFETEILPATTWAIVLPAASACSAGAARRRLDAVAGLVPASRTVLIAPAGSPRYACGDPARGNVVWHRPHRPAVIGVLAGLLRVQLLGGAKPHLLVIGDEPCIAHGTEWRWALRSALSAAAPTDRLVVLGVRPERPRAGTAWIIPAGVERCGARAVSRFLDRVDSNTAARLFEEGALVNSHSFAVSGDVLLAICARALGRATPPPFDFSIGVLAGAPNVAVLSVPERRWTARGEARTLREMS